MPRFMTFNTRFPSGSHQQIINCDMLVSMWVEGDTLIFLMSNNHRIVVNCTGGDATTLYTQISNELIS